MGSLFGKLSKSKERRENLITKHDQAVLQIKQQRDKVKQFQKKLVVQLENESAIIKKLVQQDKKQKALLLLKKKKYTEKVLERTDNELMTIENLILDIEYKNVEQNVLQGIQTGNEALKELNALFSIEQIEAILDETQEGIEKQQEITDMISGYKEESDENLEEELQEIIGHDVSLPDVPETELPEVEKQKARPKKEKKEDKILVEA